MSAPAEGAPARDEREDEGEDWDAELARETEEFEARMRGLTPEQVANLL